MSAPSLGAFSTLALQHQAKNEDCIPLEVRSTQVARESEPSSEMGRLPNVYLSERSRRSSALSRKDSYANDGLHICVLTDHHLNTLSGSAGIELSGPPSATLVPSSSTPTAHQKKTGLIQFLAICWCIYVVGWHDGSNGPLLPRIQQEYQVCPPVVLCQNVLHENRSFHS
jgi:hypothetical protein